MSCWALIPIKPSPDNKSRLASVLGRDQRQALTDAMLAHVLGIVRSAQAIERVCLVGSTSLEHNDDIDLIEDPGAGLNPAVRHALDTVADGGPDRLIIMAADLPNLTTADVEQLANVPAAAIALAPDRHHTGTNAISLPLPAAQGFSFAFGPDSFAKHKAEAARLGLDAVTIESAGLACDIDEPEDLPRADQLLGLA